MWKQMEGEGSRQAAPDGGSDGEGSHTHCVVAVMGRIDFWLKDYYGTPKSWVQGHPLPGLQTLWVLLVASFRVWPTSAAEKNIGIFRHALPSAHIWTKSSCGVDISYFEVFTCNYTELWPWQGSLCKNGEKSSNTLIQPYPNRLLSLCRSSTLLGCRGWWLSRYPPAAGSSGSTKMYSKESRHGKRGKAGQKEVMHQNQ